MGNTGPSGIVVERRKMTAWAHGRGSHKLEFARKIGAEAVVDAGKVREVVTAIRDITSGGAHVSLDGLGHPDTCFNSVACLRKRGRHVQVGLMTGDHQHPAVPMDQVIAGELEILGSHGMQAHRYPEMLELIRAGRLRPQLLIGRTISLGAATAALREMDKFSGTGITVIDRFS